MIKLLRVQGSPFGASRRFAATQQFSRLRSGADIQRAALIEPDFVPRHDGQLRCDVLEQFPPEPSRHEAGDIEDGLQLLIGEGERGHGPGRLGQPRRSGTGPKNLGTSGTAKLAGKRVSSCLARRIAQGRN